MVLVDFWIVESKGNTWFECKFIFWTLQWGLHKHTPPSGLLALHQPLHVFQEVYDPNKLLLDTSLQGVSPAVLALVNSPYLNQSQLS